MRCTVSSGSTTVSFKVTTASTRVLPTTSMLGSSVITSKLSGLTSCRKSSASVATGVGEGSRVAVGLGVAVGSGANVALGLGVAVGAGVGTEVGVGAKVGVDGTTVAVAVAVAEAEAVG